MVIESIPLDQLHAHPGNSNVMPDELFAKLVKHLERTDRYPPVIVRAHGDGYQVLDGHHRVKALRQLGREAARCVVWGVDDDEALVLLATLNRLQGTDDPRKRGELLAQIHLSRSAAEIGAMLPESKERLERLLQLARAAPQPRPPSVTDGLPAAVHFFLLPNQRRALETTLQAIGGTRESALMNLVERHAHKESCHGQADE